MTKSGTVKKILCLPGFLQSGKVFAEKSSGLRKILTKKLGFQLDYISPPNIVERRQLPFNLSDNEEEALAKWNAIVENEYNRSWWEPVQPSFYQGFDESIKYVADYIRANGPYHGIIGFSQGAAMASIITNSIQTLVPGHPPFSVSLFISGFAFTELKENNTSENRLNVNNNVEDLHEYIDKVVLTETYRNYFSPPQDLNTAIINVYGSQDNTVPPIRSKFLTTIYNSKLVHTFEHDGAHYVPNKKSFLNPIVTIFSDTLAPKSSL